MLKRTLLKSLELAAKTLPAVIVTGPRQVGKSTLLEMFAQDKKINYVSLDNLNIRNVAREEPEAFLQKYQTPLIIDEVQYAPELFSYLKIIIDQKKENGLFFLTGSQKFSLMKNVSDSLAGRIAIVNLMGFSIAELQDRADMSKPFLPTISWLEQARTKKTILSCDVFKQIWQGFFPRINTLQHPVSKTEWDLFYDGYLQTYVSRDVKDVLSISDEMSFFKFLSVVAARTGQLLNFADIAKDSQISPNTAKSWISILVTSGLLYLLPPYHNNIGKRFVKTPKLYFLDTGLCAYLSKWPTPETLEYSAFSGQIFETFVFAEILKSYRHNGKNPNFYFYRDTDQKEVDLLIEEGDTLYPVEFKKSSVATKDAAKNFEVLKKLGKTIGSGAVICLIQDDLPLTKDINCIPVGYL